MLSQLQGLKYSLLQPVNHDSQWNLPGKLHPIDSPVLIKLPLQPKWGVVKRTICKLFGVTQILECSVLAERTEPLKGWEDDRVYQTPAGETLIGKFEWTYP